MTENEAISVLKMIEAHGSLSSKAKDMAIQALEEIQQYRAIGTVEELKQAKAIYNEILLSEEKLDVPKECIAYEVGKSREKEFREYQAIGTVEELKSMKENGAFTADELVQLACMQMYLKEYQAIGTIEEFKALKEKNEQIPIIHGKSELELHDNGIRNKAIDEFAERLKSESYSGYATLEDYCEDTIESVAVEDICRIAEEMRGAE